MSTVRMVELNIDCEWQPTVVGVTMRVDHAKALVDLLQRGIAVADGEGEYDETLRLNDDATIDVSVQAYMVGQP